MIINFIALKTSHLEKTLALYRLFGFHFVVEKHDNGPEHYAANNGNILLEIYYNKSSASTDTIGIEISSAVESTFAALKDLLLEPKIILLNDQKAISIKDYDGRTIVLIAGV